MFQPLLFGRFRPFFVRKSEKTRRLGGLRSARIFSVLGQILGQGRRTPSGFAPHKQREGRPLGGEAPGCAQAREAGTRGKADHTHLLGSGILNRARAR